MKKSFYLIENYFRSKRDIHKIRMNEIETDEIKKNEENETNIWQTVVEKKDQPPPQKRTFM